MTDVIEEKTTAIKAFERRCLHLYLMIKAIFLLIINK